MILEIAAHAGRGDGRDYAWDYGHRRGAHARLMGLLAAISEVSHSAIPYQDEFSGDRVRWDIGDVVLPASLRHRIERNAFIRVA